MTTSTATRTTKVKKAASPDVTITAAELAGAAAEAFSFTGADGATYTLPRPGKLTGREVRAAVMAGEVGMLRTMYVRLDRACDGNQRHERARDALLDMDDEQSVAILHAWGEFYAGGASLGE